MEPAVRSLRLYGAATSLPAPAWADVEARLLAAPVYWVTAATDDAPHPRPVWGVWLQDVLHLSIGSPSLSRSAHGQAPLTVHLESGTEVVILEGRAEAVTTEPAVIAAYDTKYDWAYDVAVHGPLTTVRPSSVVAWRAAGWAGRDGFQAAGRWVFEPA